MASGSLDALLLTSKPYEPRNEEEGVWETRHPGRLKPLHFIATDNHTTSCRKDVLKVDALFLDIALYETLGNKLSNWFVDPGLDPELLRLTRCYRQPPPIYSFGVEGARRGRAVSLQGISDRSRPVFKLNSDTGAWETCTIQHVGENSEDTFLRIRHSSGAVEMLAFSECADLGARYACIPGDEVNIYQDSVWTPATIIHIEEGANSARLQLDNGAYITFPAFYTHSPHVVQMQ